MIWFYEGSMDIELEMKKIGQNAKDASMILACASADQKQKALENAADIIWEKKEDILIENNNDLKLAREKNLSSAMIDRLLLDEDRIQSIVDGLRSIAAQNDPIGVVLTEWDQPSGLNIQRVRTPLGVIGVIYESRPNVTADAGALCLKAGNSVILRCGSESFHSSGAVHKCLVQGLVSVGLPSSAIQLVPSRDRAIVGEMLRMTDFIDVIVPRGGKSLVGRVQSEARVPVFAHLEGICHIYIDKDADIEKTRAVIMNAKTRRIGICGSAECLLIDHEFFTKNGAIFIEDLISAGVEVRGDKTIQSIAGVIAANDQDWGKEYLDMIISAKIVNGIGDAINHLRCFSSNHTDCIMTENKSTASEFFQKVDSAIVMLNASTQFADGGEFGMGAEIGIATGKMHARGPVGVEQLTSFKYLVTGDGCVRK